MKGILRALSVVSFVALSAVVGCGSSSGGSGGSSGSGGGGGGCSKTTGTGAAESCVFASSNTPGFTCPYPAGSCSSKGLVGCCVTTTTSGQYTASAAACFYDKTTGSAAQKACSGPTEKWQTSAP